MSRRISCKFFAQGSCTKGEYCKFSHDRRDQADNAKPICTYYQRGKCTYGSHCKYEHVKVSSNPTYGSSSSNAHAHIASNSFPIVRPSDTFLAREQSTSNKPRHPTSKSSWIQKNEEYVPPENMANKLICSLAASGDCPHGERCSHIHGDLCTTCKKYCLHPYRPNEREEHIKMCQNNKQIEILKLSEEIECCVCLERVLSKPTANERKFGLLSECDHSFCISCIRNWRNNSPDSGMDVNTALRACPVCRKISYFVVPSGLWYSTQEEKQVIISNYKDRLKSIDCKHFDFGNGICPFRTRCFYRHMYRPDRSRPRPRPYSPAHRYRPSQTLFIDDVLMEFAAHLVNDEFENCDYDNLDFDDVCSFGMAEMAEMFMHLALDDSDDNEDDEEDDDEYEYE